MNNPEKIIKKMYGKFGWKWFFTNIRFWTGSFVELEKLIPNKGKILDLGCGYGILTNYLALSSNSRQMIGIDIDTNKISHADKGLKNVKFIIGDGTRMQLKNFNVILIHDVLHHLESYNAQEKLIRDCVAMLKKDGKLFIIEVDNKPFWKLVIGRFTDFFMYKGQKVYYRYKKNMIKLLEKNFSSNNIETKNFANNPFPQVLYICKKE